MPALITHGLGGALVTDGLGGSANYDFLMALVAYWENNATLNALFDNVFLGFPEMITPYPYCVVQEQCLRVDGHSTGSKGYWADYLYTFRAVSNDDDVARMAATQMADELSKIQDNKITFSNGYLMHIYQTGEVHLPEPQPGRVGAYIFHHGPIFNVRIGKTRS